MVLFANPQGQLSVTYMRIAYDQAIRNETAAREFLEKLAPEQGDVALGYKGAVTMVMAKHVFSPYKKLSWFNSGKALLEKAISNSPQQVELRYLRLTIQCNTPSFLSYNGNIRSDISFMINALADINDKDLRSRITKYLLSCKQITAAEKLTLQNIAP